MKKQILIILAATAGFHAAAQNDTLRFDGAVGTDGCRAIEYRDSRFTHWATNCVVERGPQDIASNSTLVTYGTDSMAVGSPNGSNLPVVSLGDGGKATVTFDGYITNGDGPDFAVFENSFDDNFLELAFVEVSSDGEHFVRFPATSLTQTTTQIGGTGRVDPTMINNLAGKYRTQWGTPFDLEELRDSVGLDINHITHVRMIDVVGSIDPQYGTRDHEGRLINDPYPTNNYSGGFDLDAVGVIHFLSYSGIDEPTRRNITVWPNPATTQLNVVIPDSSVLIELLDITGRRIAAHKPIPGEHLCTFNVSNLNRGIYVVRTGGQLHKVAIK